MTTVSELLKAGDLASARAALVDEVKRAPAKVEARLALADVLILLGEWDKVDTHLDLASTQDPTWTQATALLRQLVRAAAHREDTFRHGRPPELVTDPTQRIETALRILAEHRAGGDAAALRAEADEQFAPLTGELDGSSSFEGIRDLDDRTADVLEVLTSTGKYVWVSFDQVAGMTLRPVERPRDLVWRAAELEVVDGPTGVVYLPMVYPSTEGQGDALRLARETEWTEAGGLNCGLGQRCWLIGDDVLAASEVGDLAVANTAGEG